METTTLPFQDRAHPTLPRPHCREATRQSIKCHSFTNNKAKYEALVDWGSEKIDFFREFNCDSVLINIGGRTKILNMREL